MKISIIIPVYKAAQFLERAVNSVLQQPEAGEILLIEDGSPDNALEVCNRLINQHENIKLLQHPNGENRGAGASRNLGIKNAKHELIAFLDADDYFLPNRFTKDIEILSGNPKVDGVYSATQLLIKEGKAYKTDRLVTLNKEIEPELLFENMAPIIGEVGYFHINALTIRKTIIDKCGLLNTNLELSQDTEWFLRLSLNAHLAAGNLNEAVAVEILHGSNRVTDNTKIAYYRPLVFKHLLKWCKTQNVSESRKRILWKRYFFFFTLSPKFEQQTTIGKLFMRTVFLLKSFQYPFLRKFKEYYNKFPIINRFF